MNTTCHAYIFPDLMNQIEEFFGKNEGHRENKDFICLCNRIAGKKVNLKIQNGDAFEIHDDNFWIPDCCFEVITDETCKHPNAQSPHNKNTQMIQSEIYNKFISPDGNIAYQSIADLLEWGIPTISEGEFKGDKMELETEELYIRKGVGYNETYILL